MGGVIRAIRLNLLLVSSQVMFRQGLVHVLAAEQDLEVVAQAATSEEAIAKQRSLKPDLAVIDLAMTGDKGIETVRSILAMQPGARLVVLSVNGDRALVDEALALGAAGCISRTCPVEELVEVIRAVAAGRTGIRRGVPGAGTTPAEQVVPLQVKPSRDLEQAVALLTPRELEVLKLLAGGRNTKEAAYILGVSPKTVETHRIHMYKKLDCHSMVALTHLAIQAGLVIV